MAEVQEARGACAVIASSIMMEIMAAMKVFIWLESQYYAVGFIHPVSELFSEHDPKVSNRISVQAVSGVLVEVRDSQSPSFLNQVMHVSRPLREQIHWLV